MGARPLALIVATAGFAALLAQPALAQDECSSAVVVTAGVPVAFSTLTATPSLNEPSDALCADSFLLWAGSRDVWFRFTAPATGLARISTCDPTGYDTSMALYTGTCDNLTMVACNGDTLDSTGCQENPAELKNFEVIGGTTYFVRIGGYDAAAGTGTLSLTFTRVSAWGSNANGQCNPPASLGFASQLAAGAEHALAIKEDGTVAAWGSNQFQQAIVPADVGTAIRLAAGGYHNLALRSNGTVAAWGRNISGQTVVPSTLIDAIDIAAGANHSLAARATGAVVAWGSDTFQQSTVPAGLTGVVQVAAGEIHSLARRSNGAVAAWGSNTNAQTTVPASLTDAADIAAGGFHNLATRANGSVIAWGLGDFGQTAVPAGLTDVVDVAAGRYHSLALRSDGTIAAWGYNSSSQAVLPTNMGLSSSITAGAFFSVALRDACPNDPNKLELGICGCGVSDGDTDGDGAIDCFDNCPTDPNKLEPGQCGCGNPETDSDSDGTADCIDGCPSDPTKIAPGQCGCGNADTDTDGDGTADCVDACPDLAALTAPVTFYADADLDGFGALLNTASVCSVTPPAGFVVNALDCNDAALLYADADLDTFGAGAFVACDGVLLNTDCNDADASIFPGAVELCANLAFDNDCDTIASDAEAIDSINYFLDEDQDGFGVGVGTLSCSAIAGSVPNAEDCDDNREIFQDLDSDGFGSAIFVACIGVNNSNDCDDASALVNLNADETCANLAIDNDCDADLSDAEAIDHDRYFVDLDLDGFGDPQGNGTASCSPVVGLVANELDCNDADNTVYPSALENCANLAVDNNCDTIVTDAEAVDSLDYFVDGDTDTFGAGLATKSCSAIAGSVLVAGDCNDLDATAYPGAGELCADLAVDNDCDGIVTDAEASDSVAYFGDLDLDGFGAGAATLSCSPVAGLILDSSDCDDAAVLYGDLDLDTFGAGAMIACGGVLSNSDCNDADNTVYPNALENCANLAVDNNCDTIVTDAEAVDSLDYFVDGDADTFGAGLATKSCSAIEGSVLVAGDCNDADAAVYPGAVEVCSNIAVDNDCDGLLSDEEAVDSVSYCFDVDNDGFGAGAITRSCTLPVGMVANALDCDDASAEISPAALETCANDGIDNNCNGINTAAESPDSLAYSPDLDGDGFGAGDITMSCTAIAGSVINNTDCNDAAVLYTDADLDGFGAGAPIACGGVTAIGDCNDADAASSPAGIELCANLAIDNDCNGSTAEEEATDRLTFFADTDNDLFGDASVTALACSVPTGYVAIAGDNCPTNADLQNTVTYFADSDNDSFGALLSTTAVCETSAPAGFVVDSTDCDDADATISPAGLELCANLAVDNDCDGSILEDEATDRLTFFADTDNDGFGDASVTTLACSAPSGSVAIAGDNCPTNAALQNTVTYFADSDNDSFGALLSTTAVCETSAPAGFVTDSSDCDDTALLYADSDLDGHGAGAPVACGVASNDDNCPTNVALLAAVTYYADNDNDAFGAVFETTSVCETSAPAGFVVDSTDCNDTDASVHPGADELCSNLAIDNDCDRSTAEAEAIDRLTFFGDADNDGFGDASVTTLACSAPSGYVAIAGDNCPTNAALQNTVTYFADSDNDSFGALLSTTAVCETSAPAGFVTDSSDCDDTALLYADSDLDGHGAGAPVACGVASNDDNCPTNVALLTAVTYYADNDNDAFGAVFETTSVCETSAPAGFVVDSTDCDDTNAAVSPLGIELCSNLAIDNDCDHSTAEDEATDRLTFFADADNDAFGDASVTTLACSVPTGYVAIAGDNCPTNAALQNAVTYFADSDNDSFGALLSTTAVCETSAPAGFVVDSTDCNDADATISPAGLELCANLAIDNDCDGSTAEDEATDRLTFFADADNDGSGDANATTLACAAPAGFVANSDDLCPATPARIAPATWYGDADNDGAGDAAITESACDQPTGFVAVAGDNCPANGALQSGVIYYADTDSDTFGALLVTTTVCETSAPAGFVTDSSDCDDAAVMYGDADSDGFGFGAMIACGGVASSNDCNDASNAVYPGATELCADLEVDNDCDGSTAETEATDRLVFFADADQDGAGDASVTSLNCSAPAGYVSVAGDECPANGALISPLTYYSDLDGDGAGDPLVSIQSCESTAPAGYSATATDGCPADSNKTEPGACGCGVADTDSDSDGTADCSDLCPSDPNKTQPGTCGCGVADTDSDADGRADCIDNCPAIANADQRDCNGNSIGDVCEIAAGSSPDCNGNGLLDSCDIATGLSTDIDASGAPDECELVVGGTGFATIQAALDQAQNGTVIKVGPGTYPPFVVLKRGLTVQSIAGDRLTIISGGDSARCVEITGRAAIRFTLRGFTLTNGSANDGAAVLITDADPVLENCMFTENIATGSGGAIHAINSAADIAVCSFLLNAAGTGGAISVIGEAPASALFHVSNSLFRQNSSAADGGAISNAARMQLLECTLEQNVAGGLGGGVKQLATGELTLFTSRLCRNVPDNISGAFTGVGDNILSQDCNLNGICDADEIADGSVLDCNGNGIPDGCDISGGTAADCNTNGIPDSCDILSGSSTDVDTNGIPDECKPDCNGNDIPDAFEIATGAVADCNINGIPDSCDITANASLDCNTNGALDACELADGTAPDCNDNGIIDSCDIASGTADADADGRLDLCERKLGDLNLDGVVNAIDLATVLANWGAPVNGGGDTNGDGLVNAIDLATVLGNWGALLN